MQKLHFFNAFSDLAGKTKIIFLQKFTGQDNKQRTSLSACPLLVLSYTFFRKIFLFFSLAPNRNAQSIGVQVDNFFIFLFGIGKRRCRSAF